MLFSPLSYGLVVASLLSGEALAGRYDVRKRAQVVEEEVIVSQAVTVLAEPDGTFSTLAPVDVATTTVDHAGAASSPVVPVQTAPIRAVAVSSPAAAVESPSPVEALGVPSTSAPTSSASSATSAVVPTTLATVTSSGSASTPTIPATTGSKRGLAYNLASLLSAFVGDGAQATWAYNWAASPGGTVPGALEYTPMLWGLDGATTAAWDAAVTTALAAGATHLLGFNEPDLASQADIGYQDAAAGHMQWMQKYATKARLGSPAVTNGATDGMGVEYLENFIAACDSLGCTVDFVTTHWYNSATSIDDFKDHVTNSYAAGGNRPVWVTEIGATGSTEEQQTFLDAVLPWLDAQDFVERYAYFMVADGSLVSGTSVSSLGKTFAFSS